MVAEGGLRAFVANGNLRQLTVAYMRPGSAVAVARQAGRHYPTAFQSVTDSRLLVIGNGCFADLVVRDPNPRLAGPQEIVSRLNDVEAELGRFAFGSLRQRIAFNLLMITDLEGSSSEAVHLDVLAGALANPREMISRTLGPMIAPPARRTHCVSGREQGEVVGWKKGPMGRAARPGPKWPGQLRVAQAGARSQCAVQPVGHSEQISPENEPPTSLVWRSTAQEPLAPKDMGFQRGLARQRTPLRKRPRHLRSWTRGSKCVRTNWEQRFS